MPSRKAFLEKALACGVILSGGLSRRFQLPGEPWTDKALYPVEGVPMILRILRVLEDLVDEIFIAAGPDPGQRAVKYLELAPGTRVVGDDPGLRGPLAGVLSALRACSSGEAIFVPVDMPRLSRELLSELLEELRGRDVVSPILPNGLVETAVAAVRVETSRAVLEILRGSGRSRAADLARGSPRVLLLNLRSRGHSPEVVVNINRRGDLVSRPSYPEGPLDEDAEISRPFNMDDVAGKRAEKLLGSLWGTIYFGGYLEEFRLYASKGVYMFAAYALEDSGGGYEGHLARKILSMLREGLETLGG